MHLLDVLNWVVVAIQQLSIVQIEWICLLSGINTHDDGHLLPPFFLARQGNGIVIGNDIPGLQDLLFGLASLVIANNCHRGHHPCHCHPLLITGRFVIITL
jgi:hypothetical protein